MVRYEALWDDDYNAWAVVEWVGNVGTTMERFTDRREAEAAVVDYTLVHAFA